MNVGYYDKRTALHLACCEEHISCVKFLIGVFKVDLNVRDRWGSTPLEEANKSNNIRIVAVLKKHMASSKLSTQEPINEEKDSSSSGNHSPARSCESGIEPGISCENLSRKSSFEQWVANY